MSDTDTLYHNFFSLITLLHLQAFFFPYKVVFGLGNLLLQKMKDYHKDRLPRKLLSINY